VGEGGGGRVGGKGVWGEVGTGGVMVGEAGFECGEWEGWVVGGGSGWWVGVVRVRGLGNGMEGKGGGVGDGGGVRGGDCGVEGAGCGGGVRWSVREGESGVQKEWRE